MVHLQHIHDNIHTVGSSSNASSSDNEIKEAFEGLRQSSYLPPQSPSYLWTLPKDNKAGQAFMYPFVTNKPIKVAPVGHKKPKFFAQMSGSHTERPHLDFNKMQHSKRLIMVSFVWLGVVCPKWGWCTCVIVIMYCQGCMNWTIFLILQLYDEV